MSLINQVLNRLEQRGVHVASDQALRAVPDHREWNWELPALLAAAMAIAAAAIWLWFSAQPALVQSTAEKLSATQTARMKAPAALATAPASAVQPEEPLAPASKLSFELGAVPQRTVAPRAGKQAKPRKPVTSPAPVVVAPPPKPVAPEMQPAATKAEATQPAAIQPPIAKEQPASELPLKQVNQTQQADAEYHRALTLQRQGHVTEALSAFDAALKLNAQHDAARLAQAALLVEFKRSDDAERLLQDGLKLNPAHSGFSMMLARIQIERGDIEQSLATLQQNLPQAAGKADYLAFYAALLQRQGRHEEAVKYYQTAVQLAPNSGVWLMGYGISLQAINRSEDARSAYQRALATQTLSPELSAFVQQRLKGF